MEQVVEGKSNNICKWLQNYILSTTGIDIDGRGPQWEFRRLTAPVGNDEQ